MQTNLREEGKKCKQKPSCFQLPFIHSEIKDSLFFSRVFRLRYWLQLTNNPLSYDFHSLAGNFYCFSLHVKLNIELFEEIHQKFETPIDSQVLRFDFTLSFY